MSLDPKLSTDNVTVLNEVPRDLNDSSDVSVPQQPVCSGLSLRPTVEDHLVSSHVTAAAKALACCAGPLHDSELPYSV